MNMDYISSKNAWFIIIFSIFYENIHSKINTFALLQIMPFFEKDYFFDKLETILKQIIPDVHTFIENLQKLSEVEKNMKLTIPRLIISQSRINETKNSIRKEENRKNGLFDDINLKQLFLDKIKVFFILK